MADFKVVSDRLAEVVSTATAAVVSTSEGVGEVREASGDCGFAARSGVGTRGFSTLAAACSTRRWRAFWSDSGDALLKFCTPRSAGVAACSRLSNPATASFASLLAKYTPLRCEALACFKVFILCRTGEISECLRELNFFVAECSEPAGSAEWIALLLEDLGESAAVSQYAGQSRRCSSR